MRTSFFSLRQPVTVATRRQEGARATDPKTSSSPAGAPQPIDAEWLKFVGGAGTLAPVNRW